MIANILTTLRIILLIPFGYFLLTDNHLVAGILLGVAILLDYENWLTKKIGEELAFKNLYDKIADVIIVVAAMVLIVYIKFWLMYEAVIAISAIIVRGIGVYLIQKKYNFIKTTHWSKLTSLLLVGAVIYSLTDLPGLRIVIWLVLGFNIGIAIKRFAESFETQQESGMEKIEEKEEGEEEI